MSDPAEMAARHTGLLMELTELGMALAREVQAEALAATEPEVRSRLAADFHRIARSVRQSMALEARLMRERLRFEREGREIAEQAEKARRARKRATVRAHVERLVWTEVETGETDEEDFHEIMGALDDALETAVLADDFAEEAVEPLLARLFVEIGWAPGPSDAPAPGQAPAPTAPPAAPTNSS